jgi:hypothetical protein
VQNHDVRADTLDGFELMRAEQNYLAVPGQFPE